MEGAVVKASGMNEMYGNKGLSINFPLNPYAVSPAGKDEKGEEIFYPSFNAEEKIKLIDEIGINPDYKKVYAELALNNIIARIIGDSWTYGYDQFDAGSVKDNLIAPEDIYHAQSLIKAAGINLNDTNDPIYKTINKLYESRVENKQIEITKLTDNDEEFPSQAMVVLKYANPDVIDENITVKPVIVADGKEIAVGSTPAYTDNETINVDDGSVTWIVNAYDSKCYTLNDQVASFTVTYLDKDMGLYYGYIPLAYWDSAEAVKDDGTKTREDYIREQNDNNRLTPIRLNVSVSFNKNDPSKPITEYTIVNYDSVNNGGEITGTYDIDELTGLYIELLGGETDGFVNGLSDKAIYSLGTVYSGDEGLQKSLKFAQHTIADVQNFYYITDVYGNEYNLKKENLGFNGLENYKKEYELYDNSFTQSQDLAKAVRDEAAQKYEQQKAEQQNADQQSADGQNQTTLDKDELTRSIEAEAPEAVAAPALEVKETAENEETTVEEGASEEVNAENQVPATEEIVAVAEEAEEEKAADPVEALEAEKNEAAVTGETDEMSSVENATDDTSANDAIAEADEASNEEVETATEVTEENKEAEVTEETVSDSPEAIIEEAAEDDAA